MAVGLTDLSPELLLRIADLLLADESYSEQHSTQNKQAFQKIIDWYDKTVHDVGRVDADSKNRHDARPKNLRLEKGTKQQIKEDSGQEAVANLSRTCSLLYKTLSPYLVREVTLHNTTKSGRAVQYLSSTEQAKHVKTLYFKGDAPGDEEEDFHNIEAVFPAEVDDVLRNLSRFQNLITVKIDFDFLLDCSGNKKWSFDFTEKFYDEGEESRAEMEEAEAKEAWRALVKKTFEAVSCPTSDQFSELIFHYWPLCGSSAFGRSEDENPATPPLFERLAKLNAFTLNTYGGDNGAGWRLNTYLGFGTFFSQLDKYFLDGLSNITQLCIFGDPHGVIGQGEFHEALIPLRKDHVPKLKKLELGYYFVQDDLLEFLIAHSSTLEHIKFHRCYFIAPYMEDDDLDDEEDEPDAASKKTWGKWFHEYAAHQPQSLQRITFEPRDARIIPTSYPESDLEDDYKKLFKKQQTTPEHRIFPYGQVDDKYGMLFEAEIFNMRWAVKGRDLPGWEELSEVMQRNRSKAAGGTHTHPLVPV